MSRVLFMPSFCPSPQTARPHTLRAAHAAKSISDLVVTPKATKHSAQGTTKAAINHHHRLLQKREGNQIPPSKHSSGGQP